MTKKLLTLDKLDKHLFKCADIIRNAVDKTDYKDYILPLVFYKSINDTYQAEYEKRLDEFGDEEIAKDLSFHDFQIPEGYSWDKLLKKNKNIDQFLNEAFSEIEKENPDSLNGVFRADFVAADALDDSRLSRLVKHLDTYNLGVNKIPADMLGEAYMDLVRYFASEEGRDGGEFFTPPHIIKLMVRLLAPFKKGDKFHDPTCGSAGMLIEAAHYFKEAQKEDPENLILTGQEINPDIAAMAKMNLFIHGYNGEVKRGDSLSEPHFKVSDNELEKFDYILANFPFSADWDKDNLKDDKFKRFDWSEKLPRADRGDYSFIMHMVKQLNNYGQAAIVVPHGVLFRKHEGRYRQPMIEKNLLEAVIGLPENLFQNNTIPSAILVLNKNKTEIRKDKVQFIHAADEDFYKELSNQNELTEEGINHIVKNFTEWKTEERVSRIVDRDEIKENDYNLNIALYVDTTQPKENIDVKEELNKLQNIKKNREGFEKSFMSHMEVLGYE